MVRNLISLGSEVILIEKDQKLADELSLSLDCTVINAEGTHPDILEKAEIQKADAVIACTNHDQDNILIGLVARENNIDRVIIKTDDEQFLEVAKKLGFNYLINPPHIASMIIGDKLRGVDTMELSSLVRSDVRFMNIMVNEEFTGKKLSGISLPDRSAVIGIYRKKEFILARDNPHLQTDDEIILVTRAEHINNIYDQFSRHDD